MNSSGIGFCGLLTICFIVLKLIDKIDWPWWWVLAPMWIPTSIWLVIFGGIGIGALVCHFIDSQKGPRM